MCYMASRVWGLASASSTAAYFPKPTLKWRPVAGEEQFLVTLSQFRTLVVKGPMQHRLPSRRASSS